MANMYPGDVNTTEASAQDMDTARTHDIRVAQWRFAILELTWASADETDAYVTIQGSIDGTNFDEFDDSRENLNAAAGTHTWDIDCRGWHTLRVSYAKGSNTAGTYTLKSRKEVAQ